MSKAQGKNVSAVMGADGRVYFEYQDVQKPVRMPMPDWMFVSLTLVVAAGVIAAAFLI